MSEEQRQGDLPTEIHGALGVLCCPVSHQPLREAPPALVAHLNLAVRCGALRDASGTLVRQELAGGLLTADGARLYPIRAGLADLLPESAVVLTPEERAYIA
jgi:uncharacterized protein YbaR (Trm112 family)